jgi:hypothetical protein
MKIMALQEKESVKFLIPVLIKKLSVICILIGLIFGMSLSKTSAILVWEEDFETPPYDDWYLDSWDVGEWVYPFTRADCDPIIANGSIHLSADSGDNVNTDPVLLSNAFHNSTVAYGTWSIDFYIPEDQDSEILGGIWIIGNNWGNGSFNISGVIYPHFRMYTRSYIVYIQAGTQGWGPSYSINMNMYDSGEYIRVGDYVLGSTSNFTGYHHLDIIRDLTGIFTFYYDSKQIFQATDNNINTSEHLVLFSLMGNISFDNITVSDSIEMTTTTTTTSKSWFFGNEFETLTAVIILSMFYLRKRKH